MLTKYTVQRKVFFFVFFPPISECDCQLLCDSGLSVRAETLFSFLVTVPDSYPESHDLFQESGDFKREG